MRVGHENMNTQQPLPPSTINALVTALLALSLQKRENSLLNVAV